MRSKIIALFTTFEHLICNSVSNLILGAETEFTLSALDGGLYLAIDVIGKEIHSGIM